MYFWFVFLNASSHLCFRLFLCHYHHHVNALWSGFGRVVKAAGVFVISDGSARWGFFFFFFFCVRQVVYQIFRSINEATWAVRWRSSTVSHSLVARSVLFSQVFRHLSSWSGQVWRTWSGVWSDAPHRHRYVSATPILFTCEHLGSNALCAVGTSDFGISDVRWNLRLQIAFLV